MNILVCLRWMALDLDHKVPVEAKSIGHYVPDIVVFSRLKSLWLWLKFIDSYGMYSLPKTKVVTENETVCRVLDGEG